MLPRFLLGALFLGLTLVAESATLRSTLVVRRSGGTATGSFVEAGLPSFIISGHGAGGFRIQSAGTTTVGTGWEFLVNADQQVRLFTSPTFDLADATQTFQRGQRVIDHSALGFVTDTRNPDPVAFLIGRLGDDFYAFRVSRENPNNERLRLYSDVLDVQPFNSARLAPIPEPSTALLLAPLAALACRRRREPR